MLRTESHSPIYQQIILHFESRIFDGSLKAGARIPATNELAKSFNVNPETVQTALKRLMERGLVERRRGAGTFVRKGVCGKTAAIVFGENNFTRIDRAFFNALLKRLMARLPEAGWNFKHFITTEKPEADAAFHELEKGVADGSIRAVIEFCSNNMIKDWLESHPFVPSSTRASFVDFADIFAQSFKRLLELGRRRILAICVKEGVAIEECRRIAAGIDPEGAAKLKLVSAEETQKAGYEAASEALDAKDWRPDAIISLCDSATRGILFAMLERGVKIPSDCALITHSNKGVELFSHLPLTRLEVDPDKVATAMLEEIVCKIEGKTFNESPVKASLIPGRSCGEIE